MVCVCCMRFVNVHSLDNHLKSELLHPKIRWQYVLFVVCVVQICLHLCVHCHDTSSMQAKSGRYISIKHEGEMELYHKKPSDSFQSSSLWRIILTTLPSGNQVGEHILLKHLYLYCDKFVSLLNWLLSYNFKRLFCNVFILEPYNNCVGIFVRNLWFLFWSCTVL